MGLFDLFGELAPELQDLGNELQGIKDDFVSSVVDPSGELRDTINGIASDITGGTVGDESASSDTVDEA